MIGISVLCPSTTPRPRVLGRRIQPSPPRAALQDTGLWATKTRELYSLISPALVEQTRQSRHVKMIRVSSTSGASPMHGI